MRPSFAAALLIITPVTAHAQGTPSDLGDLVGARAGQAEGELSRRGYQFIRGEKGDDRSYTTWWNASRRQCVTIATMEGRYNSITVTPAPDCRRSSANPDRPAIPQPVQRPRPDDRVDPSYSPAPVVVGGRPIQLALVCFGDGTRPGVASSRSWQWNDRKSRYELAYQTRTTTEAFETSLMIQIWDGGGRIRLPRSLVPPINSRGSDGWWDLRDVSAGPDAITATYRLNGLNRPRLTVDRRTGRITVRGAVNYSFQGNCDEVGRTGRRF